MTFSQLLAKAIANRDLGVVRNGVMVLTALVLLLNLAVDLLHGWIDPRLRTRVASGEAYDWYYASDAARHQQTRTPITDGAYGKPWVWRASTMSPSNPAAKRVYEILWAPIWPMPPRNAA